MATRFDRLLRFPFSWREVRAGVARQLGKDRPEDSKQRGFKKPEGCVSLRSAQSEAHEVLSLGGRRTSDPKPYLLRDETQA